MIEHDRHASPEEWEDLWGAERPPAALNAMDLRAEVARRRRRMIFVVAGEVVLTIGLIALTLVLLGGDGVVPAERAFWLLLVWLTWTVAAGFAFWNRRGVWAPAAETARSYLALSEERARRRRRVAFFVFGLTVALMATLQVVGMLTLRSLVVASLYTGWAAWYGRAAHRDLQEVRRVAVEFDDEARV